jgi:tetratricopeptide (TPR) repeat protein
MSREAVSGPSKESVKVGLLSSSVVQGMLIVGICLLAYSNTFHVPFQFDDVHNIVQKPFVRDIRHFLDFPATKWFAGDYAFRMRTVGYFTFALNYWLHGTDVVGYHIVNLAVHAVNALLVYFLVLLTFRTPFFCNPSTPPLRLSGGRVGSFIALFAALLFVSHPIQTQAVTYIVQRLTSLATLFYLFSVVSYVKARLMPSGGSSNYRSLLWYSLSFVSAVLAMKTKEIAFTLPMVIALYEAIFFQGEVKKRVLRLVPLLLTMLIIPIGLVGAGKPLGEVMSDTSTVTRVQSALSRGEYLATELRVLVTYIRLLLFPVGQNLDYDYPVYDSFSTPPVFLSFLFLSLIFGTAIYLLWKAHRAENIEQSEKDVNSKPHSLNPMPFVFYCRLTAFGIFWFFIALAVESSVIPIADVIFEHRLYLPSVGLFLACTGALFLGAERLRARWAWSEKAVLAALAAVVLLLTGLTYARNTVWQSEVSLWQDVIQKSPLKARGYNGLGLAYYNMRQYDRAIGEFSRAIVLHPSYGVAFNNIGNAFFHIGRYDRATEAQTKAIALEPRNPVFLFNRGLTYAAKGEYDRAIEDYEGAIVLDPAYSEAYNNLGIVYYQKGLYPMAVEAYAKAIAFDPGQGIFYNNRGLAHSGNGDYGRAIDDYTRAITLSPDLAVAYNGRGAAYGFLGRYGEAIADFNRAISLEPGSAALYTNRGVAYARAGQRDKALSDFQRACDMGDDNGCRALQTVLKK